MKLSTLATVAAALLGARHITGLPYPLSVGCFVLFAVLAVLGHVRKLNLLGYAAFFGFIILSAIMEGYRADVTSTGGTVRPELTVGIIGTVLIIAEELSARRREGSG